MKNDLVEKIKKAREVVQALTSLALEISTLWAIIKYIILPLVY